MGLYRLESDIGLTFYKGEEYIHQFNNKNEWFDESKNLNIVEESRIDIPSWQYRYNYESSILNEIIKNNNFKKIIELGSGPGELGQKLINDDIDYTFVDQQGAYKIFIERKFKGTFKVKDLSNSFDISDLDNNYDFLITNDFLEHIFNPSAVLQNAYKILKPNSKLFVSVPNWRMGHTFIYRGLFDFDNFIYFAKTHGFEIKGLYDSPLKCNYYPKLSSESDMDDRLIESWNWYMLFDKIK